MIFAQAKWNSTLNIIHNYIQFFFVIIETYSALVILVIPSLIFMVQLLDR